MLEHHPACSCQFPGNGPDISTTDIDQLAPANQSRRWELTVPRLTLLMAAALGAAIIIGNRLINSIQTQDKLIVAAHRGAAGKAPENTIASVHLAIDDGADWVEIDVQESADGEVVVIHDSDLMKLAGVDLNVRDGTRQQLQDIDVGSWFSPEFSKQRIPTLVEVLEATRGKSRVVIELKYYGHDQQLEQHVVDIVEQTGMTVNDPVAMSRMMTFGVDGIITDEPAMAREVLAERADLSSVERLLVHTAVLFGRPPPSRLYRDESP